MILRKLRVSKFVLKIAISVCFSALIFNEFLIYYFTIWHCNWPKLKKKNDNSLQDTTLRLLILSDPHLLGQREGHWFDKLRREWQIYRSYQTSLTLLAPDVVFILGDLFDEGKWADDKEWKTYVEGAKRIFKTPGNTPLYTLVGNHDIGFHNSVTPNKISRFYKEYNTKHVNLINIKGISFVLLNSMAFHNDGCKMCSEAQQQLTNISQILKCSKSMQGSNECSLMGSFDYIESSQPIILQHFPLYRESDSLCHEIDSVPKNKLKNFIEKKDCVSEESSNQILDSLEPRLVISGHTHYGCHYFHKNNLLEVSVPSFNWRNRNDPSFYLVTVSADDYALFKCFLPKETTVFLIYALIPLFTIILVQIYYKHQSRRGLNEKIL